jgi:hypothetical protein
MVTVDTLRIAQPTTTDSREERALQLYRTHGGGIRHLSGAIYRVPSQDGERSYDVEYGKRERCSCPDYLYRGGTCVHLYVLAIATAKGSIQHPELVAGDPFAHAAATREPCACLGGWVFVGYEDEFGEEREAAYRCRRCASEAGR